MNLRHASETDASRANLPDPVPGSDAKTLQAVSVVWFMVSLTAWAYAAARGVEPIADGSSLTALGLIVLAISLAWRVPLLRASFNASTLDEHVIWLLSVAACLNWLGFLSLVTDQSLEAVPSIVTWLCGEGWLTHRLRRVKRLVWLKACWEPIPQQFAAVFVSQPSIALVDASSPTLGESHENESELRRTIESINEDGQRYLSGEVRIRFEPGQVTETVVIGFCPALLGMPTIEAETMDVCDIGPQDTELGDATNTELGDATNTEPCDASIAIRVMNCTPAGARISLRRSDRNNRRSVTLLWYAVGDESSEATGAKAVVGQEIANAALQLP